MSKIENVAYGIVGGIFQGNTAQIGGEDSARDFETEKGSFSQAYFVYVKKIGRISGGKDRL